MDGVRQELLTVHTARLRAANVDSPQWDATQLIDAVIPRGAAPTPAQIAELDALVAKRAQRVPLQLILESTGFYSITVACARGVFIPRPETEVLVTTVLHELGALAAPRVIEPCTGSGAITASLLAECSDVEVHATDISAGAVALATRNVARVVTGAAGVPARPATARAWVTLGSLFAPVPSVWQQTVDVIVSNPPYLSEAVFAELPPEVRDYDPYGALVGGCDGHEIVADLCGEAPRWLKPGGLLALEVDVMRVDDACDRAVSAGLVDVKVIPDLTGADRFVTARTP